jgi:hypothetical protein
MPFNCVVHIKWICPLFPHYQITCSLSLLHQNDSDHFFFLKGKLILLKAQFGTRCTKEAKTVYKHSEE